MWLHTTLEGLWPHDIILKVSWDNGLWTLSFGLSQFHGHGSWLVCEVALKPRPLCLHYGLKPIGGYVVVEIYMLPTVAKVIYAWAKSNPNFVLISWFLANGPVYFWLGSGLRRLNNVVFPLPSIHSQFFWTWWNLFFKCKFYHYVTKVETPYHDNDLILTPIISPQSGWQWTWSCPELHMGGFRDVGWQFLTFGRCH
jgi:hypothetical protein